MNGKVITVIQREKVSGSSLCCVRRRKGDEWTQPSADSKNVPKGDVKEVERSEEVRRNLIRSHTIVIQKDMYFPI